MCFFKKSACGKSGPSFKSFRDHHIISYHLVSSYSISYHLISYHLISSHIISYHIILHHIKRTYILLQQQDIFSSHKKTSSSLTRRHSMSPDHIYSLQTHHLGSIRVRTSKNQVFNFFPDSSHDLWDVEYYHH